MTGISLFFALFFAFIFSIFALVFFLPRVIIQLRARKNGLEIDLREAYLIQTHHCAKKEFYQGAKLVLEFDNIPIEELATHFLVSGDLKNIGLGMEELKKRNRTVEFPMLCAIDLTGKNLKNEIINSETHRDFEIKNIKNDNLILDYKVTYRYEFPYSVFLDHSDNSIIEKIKLKLEVFLSDWKETNVFETESFIRNNILPTDFWGKELSGLVVKQEFKIRKNRR